ncbi:hypothetical protein [Jiella marina]|uniref:hypothetical protein n=1 Tax=Jiella sp. LLJ827 TaxID=2917712 RepID=UPI00210113CF|nr:hypothetical protein [Jiella sp. LLJ827]MCQ0990611.1 hypothetical protein [Jiella sp. LLJ827]
MDKERYQIRGETWQRNKRHGAAEPEKERQFFKEIGQAVKDHYERGGDPAAIEKTLRFYADERDRLDPLKWRQEVDEKVAVLSGPGRPIRQAEKLAPLSERVEAWNRNPSKSSKSQAATNRAVEASNRRTAEISAETKNADSYTKTLDKPLGWATTAAKVLKRLPPRDKDRDRDR